MTKVITSDGCLDLLGSRVMAHYCRFRKRVGIAQRADTVCGGVGALGERPPVGGQAIALLQTTAEGCASYRAGWEIPG
jgi:hypothetical protein